MTRFTSHICKRVHQSYKANYSHTVVNDRVCLALLGIFRAVAFIRTDRNSSEVVSSFRPVIRLNAVFLKGALQEWHEHQARENVAWVFSRFLNPSAWAAAAFDQWVDELPAEHHTEADATPAAMGFI